MMNMDIYMETRIIRPAAKGVAANKDELPIIHRKKRNGRTFLSSLLSLVFVCFISIPSFSTICSRILDNNKFINNDNDNNSLKNSSVNVSSQPTIPYYIETTNNHSNHNNHNNHNDQLGNSTFVVVLENDAKNQTKNVIDNSNITNAAIIDSNNNNNNNINKKKAKTTKKWFLYFTESGWSNQLRCLEHAFYLARKLPDRGLLLPPVLPQGGKGGLSPWTVFDPKKGIFTLPKENLEQFYLKKKRLPPELYVPMHHVLDLEFSLPGINTMDVKEFYTNQLPKILLQEDEEEEEEKSKDYNQTAATHGTISSSSSLESPSPTKQEGLKATTWFLETEYSHFNTIWTYQRPDLEGQQKILEKTEYGVAHVLNMTYRDIATSLIMPRRQKDDGKSDANNKNKNNDNNNSSLFRIPNDALVISFLDAYHTQIEPTSMMEPRFRPRFSEPIRSTAKNIRNGWNVTDYAAIHIRGRDGGFKDPARIDETITNAMDQIMTHMQEWADFRSSTRQMIAVDINTSITTVLVEEGITRSSSPASAMSSSSSIDNDIVVVGLYIATDIRADLVTHPIFQNKTETLKSAMQDSYNITVDLLWGVVFSENDPLKKDVRYPETFVDQQIASCATIGFVGTAVSTFTAVIEKLRQNSEAGC